MIVYGWNTKTLRQAPLENYECPSCHQKESVILIIANYVHIFWIPFIPYKKSAVVFCNACRLETDEKAITLGTGVTTKQLKATVPLPKYLFSGLVIILLAIGYFTYAGMQDGKQEQSYLEDPQIGDVYFIKTNVDTSEYNLYLLKVRAVAGDSLWVSSGSYFYNGIVSQLEPDDGFYDIMYPMNKAALAEFQQSGELKKVVRDYGPSSGFDRDLQYQESDTLFDID